jgi:hypothetical protein
MLAHLFADKRLSLRERASSVSKCKAFLACPCQTKDGGGTKA